MDRQVALRLDIIIVLVSLILGGVVTTPFFIGAESFIILSTILVGGVVAVFALGVARGGLV
jgi:hypothetical protein